MVTAYAWRTMHDTPHYVNQNPSVTTLTDCAERTGWDTPISGDMLRLATTYTDDPHNDTMALALRVLPNLTNAEVTAYIAESNATTREERDPDYTSESEWRDSHRRRFAVGSIYPMWGDLAHNVTYVTVDGDVFTHYPSDPTSRVTYTGRQDVTA